MKPAAPAGSRAGLALALLCLAAPARADELCTSWYAAHERCHDAHATDDDASCCEGSDIQASCQCASATGWWNNRRLSAVDEPRRLGHCCDYGAYCSCMESELGAGCAAPDDECGEDGDEDEDWYEDWMWDGGCQPEYCTSTDGRRSIARPPTATTVTTAARPQKTGASRRHARTATLRCRQTRPRTTACTRAAPRLSPCLAA